MPSWTSLFPSCFFFYLLDDWRQEKTRFRLLICIVAGLLVSMVWGILDSRNILPLDWYRPVRGSPLKFARHTHRLQSFFSHAGWYAQWLALLAPLPLACFLAPGGRSKTARAVALGIFLVAIPTMLLTYQRGGWFSFAAGFGVVCAMTAVLYLRFPATRKRGVAILAGGGLLVLILAAVLWAGARDKETSLAWRIRNALRYQDRRDIWASALELHRRYPFRGTGMGLYFVRHDQNFPRWHPYSYVERGEAHNTYLHLLAERGPFALLAMMGAVLAATGLFLRAWWASDPASREAAWAIAACGVMAAWAVYGVVQHMFYIRVVDLTFFIVLAFGILGAQKARET